MTWARLKKKKKFASNTSKDAHETLRTRCKLPTFHAGSKPPKNEVELAMRIASHSEARWTKEVARWNLGLSSTTRTSRSVGRPRQRWEDDINQIRENGRNWRNTRE